MKSKLALLFVALIVWCYGIGVGRYEWFPMKLFLSLKEAEPVIQLPPARALQIGMAETYRALPAETSVDVVMLGDSIAHFGPWSELLPDIKVLNRGIPGDTSDGVLSRLDEVIRHNPETVVLMIGINDLASGVEPEIVAKNIAETASKLSDEGIRVIVADVLYTRKPVYSQNYFIPDKIELCNRLISKIAVEHIDLNAGFSTNQAIGASYAVDGVHLSAEAYTEFAAEVVEVLNMSFIDQPN